MPVFKACQENKEPRVNAVPLAPRVQWDLPETKDRRENAVFRDQRVPPDQREALENQENRESPERRVPTVPLVAQETRVPQDLVALLDHLDVMALLESPDPLDLQVPRENTENLVLRDLKVFLAPLVSLAQREILDPLVKMAKPDLVDLRAPEVTMARMAIRELPGPQDLLASKEREVAPDLREIKVSRAFQDLLVIPERLADPVKLV